MVQTQVIVAGMQGVILDLNHLAVWGAIDRFGKRLGIVDPEMAFQLILHISRFFRNKEEEERRMNSMGGKE